MNKISGKIINYDGSYTGTIEFSDKIESIDIDKDKQSDFENLIIPGFIDLHCHGGNGFDTMAGFSSIIEMSKYHLKQGTTTILPTTLTATLDDTVKALEGLGDFINQNNNLTNIISEDKKYILLDGAHRIVASYIENKNNILAYILII